MAEGAEDRTEAATPARLLRAKSDGGAPVAREVPVLAGLVTGTFVLAASMAGNALHLVEAMATVLGSAGEPLEAKSLMQLIWSLLLVSFHVVAGIGAASAAAIIVANFMQTGFAFKLSALGGDFSRVSPTVGLKRLFSAENGMSAIKSVVKIVTIGSVMVALILARREQLLSVLVASPSEVAKIIGQAVLTIAAAMLGVQGVIALADLAWTRVQFTKSMRMSRTEIKDETKDADGNPHIKARLKKIMTARSQQNLKSVMSRATVVITNPTHYAVALDYKKGQTAAPKIIAKGAGDLAARIRAFANTERVPIVSNPPLARALFKLDLESEIPAEHYKAVAEIIAYIWGLSGRITQDQQRL